MAGANADKSLPAANAEAKAEIMQSVVDALQPMLQAGKITDKELVDAYSVVIGGCLKALSHVLVNCNEPKVYATVIGILTDKKLAVEGRLPTSSPTSGMSPSERKAMEARLAELKTKGKGTGE